MCSAFFILKGENENGKSTGLVSNCSSVNKIAEHCTKSPIIREILGGISLSQSALSRFLCLTAILCACSNWFFKSL